MVEYSYNVPYLQVHQWPILIHCYRKCTLQLLTQVNCIYFSSPTLIKLELMACIRHLLNFNEILYNIHFKIKGLQTLVQFTEQNEDLKIFCISLYVLQILYQNLSCFFSFLQFLCINLIWYGTWPVSKWFWSFCAQRATFCQNTSTDQLRLII